MKSFALLVAATGPAALVSAFGRHWFDSTRIDSDWVERLGWTLIHTVWQFALIALVAAVLHWSLRRRSARARYTAGVVLLGVMAVAPGVTFCVVDVSRPAEMKQARIASTDTMDEITPRDALARSHSALLESADDESPEQGATPPSRRAIETRDARGTHFAPRVAPHERLSLSWVTAIRSTLAPRLPFLVSLWLAGMALFSLRPVWGVWMQWRLRRVGLTPVPASVTHCLNDLAQRLGLRRTVSVAQSVRIGVPMAVGYLRPLILLPGCVITGLTAAQLEALIAHELAHIRRHDWFVNAFQLLVETVFFYHPAVWWLSRQIRQERENCCDDLAVLLVGDRGTVGRMLLALEELRDRPSGLALAATGGNLLSRVRRVVAKGRQPEPAGREWLPAAVLLLLAGLGGAAWAMSAGTAEEKNPPPAAPAATANSGVPSDAKNAANPAAKAFDVRRITGRIVDSKGQPIQVARLWWVVLDDSPNDRQFTVEGTSDAQGLFSLEAPAAWKPRHPRSSFADILWIFAPGKELKVVRATGPTVGGNKDNAKEKDTPHLISLKPAIQTEYTVSDEQGRPIVGAVLDPWRYRTPRGTEFLSIGIRDLLRRTTDSSGRARLTSLSREDLYDVQIRAANFGTLLQQLGGVGAAPPPQGKITLRATGCIEGRLLCDDPQWARGVQLTFSTEQPRQSLKTVPVPPGGAQSDVIYGAMGVATVETDVQGRFRIPEIAIGSIFIGGGPINGPFVPRLPSGLSLKAGETVHIDIPMERVVLVKGTIRTDNAQAPVAGAEIAVRYGNRGYTEMVTSDREGHFQAHVQAGPVHTRVMKLPREIGERYQQAGDLWSKQIDVPAGQREFELPSIVLASTDMRKGTLVDQHGRPVAGARVSGFRSNRFYGYAETNARGEFSLQLPQKRAMVFYSVQIPASHFVFRATILKYEPLTLQIGLPETHEKPKKPTQDAGPSPADKREKRDEPNHPASAPSAPPSTAQPSTTLTGPAQSKSSFGSPSLTGKVSDSEGKPVAGATVMVWTAGVKHGYSTYCPSCYVDCGKRAVTDAEGGFVISHVSPELRFRLLIVREGYAPVFVDKVDPYGGPADVKLSRRRSPDDARCVVHGHVVGPRGEPLTGAVVEAESVWYEDHGRHTRTWGDPKGLDPLAVANDRGDFEIAYAKPAMSITLMVRAPGMAPQRFPGVGTGTERHTLALNRGASIRGRLVRHGRPVGRAEIGLISFDRVIDDFVPEVRVGTEPDGSFLFANVPVPGQWYVYAKMDSVHSQGATDAVKCVTEQEDETVNLGDVTVQPGHRLRGRVILTDGKPVPDGMRILLSTQRAWDNQTHELPPDGRFEFVGLPTDDFSINPAVKGYQPSPENPNRNLGIDGLIDRDVDNFVILLDPGKDRMNRIGEDFKGKVLRSAPTP